MLAESSEWWGRLTNQDDDEGNEKYFTVEEYMVETVPTLRTQAQEIEMSAVASVWRSRNNLIWEILKKVDCCTLIELLGWVLQDTEDDSLGRGADDGEDPRSENHHPIYQCHVQKKQTQIHSVYRVQTDFRHLKLLSWIAYFCKENWLWKHFSNEH